MDEVRGALFDCVEVEFLVVVVGFAVLGVDRGGLLGGLGFGELLLLLSEVGHHVTNVVAVEKCILR